MKVYLAAPYGSREQIRALAATTDHTITSSWLHETHEINPGTQGPAAALANDIVADHARQDLADVDEADVLILFTANAVGVEGGGGRHIETGYALAHGKPVVVIGVPENIFHRLGAPAVTVVPNWARALEHIANTHTTEETHR